MKKSLIIATLVSGAAVLLLAASQTDVHNMESSAVGRTRTLNTAEVTYAATYKNLGFACNIARLGGHKDVKPTPDLAFLVDESLASGHYNGYHFTLRCPDDDVPADQVRVEAIPDDPGSGARAFCSELHGGGMAPTGGGVIWYAQDGKAETCWMNGIPLR